MRYPSGQTAERSERILDEASRLFRANGIAGASIAQVMKASGLTHGAFYAHFDSKEVLACASLERAMDQLALKLEETVSSSDAPRDAFLAMYLSEQHRDHPEAGCAMPALAIDVAREPGMRRSFTQGLVRMIESLRSGLTWRRGRSTEDQATSFVAAIVGAMVLARAVDDKQLSARILRATRDELLELDAQVERAALQEPTAPVNVAASTRDSFELSSMLDNIELQNSAFVRETPLAFALYSASNRMIRLHKPLLDPLGLTFPQYLAMLELYSAAPRTVGDLGASLGMDTGTITPLLKRLEASGRVTRTRDKEDERRVLIALTDAGEALRAELLAVGEQIKAICPLAGQEALRETLTVFAQTDGG
ncbi:MULTISPECIES: transcriptional regulator, SarA/Rot family [Pseudomonas]|uniref:transcriptional regulator, SarA/Rot family n=1 Tax=Pseudomonas TaxID=286 RepID=UPI001BE581A1|nr:MULTISPECIES: MarR family transcriptional regulator [Pseudomonas]MBT2341199.1 MarR family transcriptional regulator [Pseudomonas fluorescens]MCD4531288.1 MarR family transcriptional regulator [Pseudomonas sp. C3-2018]